MYHASPLVQQQPVLPGAQTVALKQSDAAVPVTSVAPALPSLVGGNASIIHYAMSAAYDAALVHVRSLVLGAKASHFLGTSCQISIYNSF